MCAQPDRWLDRLAWAHTGIVMGDRPMRVIKGQRLARWTFAWALSVLLALGGVYGAAVAAPGSGAAPMVARYATDQPCIDTEEAAFLGLINQYRAQNGRGALAYSGTLSAAANYHSWEMAEYNYFDHTLRGGVTWAQNIANFGYTANTYKAENIAAGYETAAAVFNAWKNSPGHNANMLSPNYTVIGIGRSYDVDATYDWYWTNTFGGQALSGDGAATCGTNPGPGPTPSPTPAPTATATPSPSPAPGAAYRITRSVRTSGSNSSSYAYDGRTSTAWITNATTPSAAYIYFDLGSTNAIGSVQWMWQTGGLADAWRIEVSNDAVNWTLVANRGNQKAGVFTTQAVGQSARYVRFYFTNPNRDAQLGSVAEVKILP